MLSNDGLNPSDEQKAVNRNSVEEEEHSEDSEDLWDDHEKDDVISAEFEAFSDTDSETHQEDGEDGEDHGEDTPGTTGNTGAHTITVMVFIHKLTGHHHLQ